MRFAKIIGYLLDQLWLAGATTRDANFDDLSDMHDCGLDYLRLVIEL